MGLEDSSPLQSGKMISEVVAEPQCQGEGLLPFELYHMFGGGLGVYVMLPQRIWGLLLFKVYHVFPLVM